MTGFLWKIFEEMFGGLNFILHFCSGKVTN
nr:MAG TPA: hypothetical protein [Caudoviricetes sp.]